MMKSFSFEEFKPSIFFLLKFLGLYVVGNVAYGVYVQLWYPAVDPITAWVTHQTSDFLSLLGWATQVADQAQKATSDILYRDAAIVSVFEGCNGLNVMIIFVAFLLAFGPYQKRLGWFIPIGIVIIHGFNLIRIGLLFYISIELPRFLYFTHKYLFTAILYIVIFLLWVVWFRISKPVQHDAK